MILAFSEIILVLYYGASLIDHDWIACFEYACRASALSSLYRFLHFHMKIAVIHQAYKVEASFALLQHEYPNLISSVPSVLYVVQILLNLQVYESIVV